MAQTTRTSQIVLVLPSEQAGEKAAATARKMGFVVSLQPDLERGVWVCTGTRPKARPGPTSDVAPKPRCDQELPSPV